MPEDTTKPCSSCGTMIFFATSTKGRTCPYDVQVVAAGRPGPRAYTMDNNGTMREVAPGEPGHQSHFATCPNPSLHRHN